MPINKFKMYRTLCKMCKKDMGVSLRLSFGSGYTLAETWHATSVLHRLRKLRAFRSYPSRKNKVKKFVLYFLMKCCF